MSTSRKLSQLNTQPRGQEGSLAIAVSLSAEGTVPTEFRMFAKGVNGTKKGAFLFDDVAALAVQEAAKEWGLDAFNLDYEHDLTNPAVPGSQKVSAGSFKPEVRDGELWATDVHWTEVAAAKLRAREFRHISPVFLHVDAGKGVRRIVELINCTLTNHPATKRARALVAASIGAADDTPAPPPPPAKDPTTMNPKLLLLLATLSINLPATATDDDAQSAIVKRFAELSRVEADLLAKTGQKTLVEALAMVEVFRRDAEGAAAKLAELNTKIAELNARTLKADVTATVDGLIAAGKITPADREFATQLGIDAPAAFEKYCASRGVVQPLANNGAPATQVAPPAGGTTAGGAQLVELTIPTLTDADWIQIKASGKTPDEYIKSVNDTRKEDFARAKTR